MLADNEIVIVDGVAFDEELLHITLTKPDKKQVRDDVIWPWVRDVLGPLAAKHHPAGHEGVYAATSHVVISNRGVGVHDHRCYLLTAILYLTDSEGALVVDPRGKAIEVLPKAGRLVIMRGSMEHMAKASPQPEMRVAIVCDMSDDNMLMPLINSDPEGLDKEEIFAILARNRGITRD